MKKRFSLIAFALLTLFTLACLSPKSDLLARMLTMDDNIQKADVVVAVSAGILNNCNAPPNLFLREKHAAQLVKNGYSQSGKLLISGIYTHPPHSLRACQAKLATLLDIPAERLIIDNTAETTLDNATHTKAMMRRHGWKTALLVTSRSHMFRAYHVFRKQGIHAFRAQVPELPPVQDTRWFNPNRISHLKRFLYEYGALVKYKWYGYI